MTRIELAPEVLEDFDRFFDHLTQFDVPDFSQRIGNMVQAIHLLTHSPLISRKVKGAKRELVIGRGSHGCVALYRHVADIDTVFVLAVRSQREAGYARHPAGPSHNGD